MDNNLWSRISEPAKDLVSKLLTVDESERLSAELALKHPWIADRTLAPRIHLNETVENIRKYNFRRKLKVILFCPYYYDECDIKFMVCF